MNDAPRHAHAADLEATLDFLNTLELCATRAHPEWGGVHERLRTPDEAAEWLGSRGLLHRDAVPGAAGGRTLARIHAARAAFRELFDAVAERRPPAGEAVELVNELLASRDVPALETTADGVTLTHRHVGDPLDEALARLAGPLLSSLGSGAAERFRVCANETCRYAFYDESRAGRRRWCDMATCGNRAKAARHRERRAAQPRTVPGAGPAAGS